ncbi:MAG: alpha/beta hydrolase [Spirochaetes bacterium]|nr:alpha/beta hydrolase [Spirochaetota bacterium]
MQSEKITFYNSKYRKLSGKIYNTADKSHGVIFCHGMFSTKDGYKITHLSESIVEAGYNLFCFDFSFSGDSEDSIEDLSVLQELDDLKNAVSFFTDYGIENIHLIGSSLGGLVSLLYSSINANMVSQTLIAAPIMLPEVFASGTDIKSLPEEGTTLLDGKQINNRFFKELMEINIEEAIKNTKVPSLIIHGFADAVVPVMNGVDLVKKLNCEKRIVIIQDGDHNLTRDSDLSVLSGNILEWLNGHRN